MRRILQFTLLLLTLAAFLTPVFEAIDRWDPPGLDNDTEMRVFTFVLALSLVLLVSKLIAFLELIAPTLQSAGVSLTASRPLFAEDTGSRSATTFEAFSPPLRI